MEGCPEVDPLGTGFWTIPFVVGILVLFKKDVSKKSAIFIMICVSLKIRPTSGWILSLPVTSGQIFVTRFTA